MSISDKALIQLAIRTCGTRRAVARRLGISTRKLRMLYAGQRKLWLGRTIPVHLKPCDRHALRAIVRSEP